MNRVDDFIKAHFPLYQGTNMNKDTGEVIFLRTPYNYDTDRVSHETGTDCGPTTKTQRQFKEEVDINTIVERFNVTGMKPPQGNFPTEQEFTEAFDFQTSMNVMVKARETFMELPAKARARFMNDPQRFMEFIHDPDNMQEAVKLGLAVKKDYQTETRPAGVKDSEVKLPLGDNKEKKETDTK